MKCTCAQCGQGFVQNDGRGRKRLYCVACRPRRVDARRRKRPPAPKVEPLPVRCPICGESFVQVASYQKYCNPKCRYLAKAPKSPCGVCGELMYVSSTSLPRGEAAHRRCKPELHGVGRYGKGCRCEVCTEANRVAAKAYRERTNYYSLPEVQLRRSAYYSDPDRKSRYRDVDRARRARREAAVRSAATADFTAEDLMFRLSMFAGCWICGCDLSEGLHIDHVKPLSKGGAHMLSNLRPACPTCNIRKGATWPFRALPKRPERVA